MFLHAFFTNNPNPWRSTMKVSQAVDFHLQYHRANSKKKYHQNLWVCPIPFHGPVWKTWFGQHISGRGAGLSDFSDQKQQTGDEKKPILASFYNFSINTGLPALTNPCNAAVIKKIFKRPQAIQWNIVDKETIDEIIFRTMNTRNRLMLELMARGAMRVGEVLNLTPVDIQERTLSIQNPKSGRVGEIVYVPRKLLVRLNDYVRINKIGLNDRIVPISYVAAWSMVK